MEVAEVKIWGELAGAVAWDAAACYAVFEYDPEFRQAGWDLTPLKMPVADNRSQFSFPELRKDRNSEYDTFKGLPGLPAECASYYVARDHEMYTPQTKWYISRSK